MCGETLLTYTSCKCQIMVKTICFDYIQHTIKQEDAKPCAKATPGIFAIKSIPTNCFLKEGQRLEGGRIFEHGSRHIRLVYEFERDPNSPQQRWERWERKNRDKPRQRTDSTDVNISAGEDRMNIEADRINGSHKEREPKIREWQEKTKNERQPRVKIEQDSRKEQPAVGRKTVNQVLEDPRSDDEILDDDDWNPVPKIKIEPGDTVPWSANNSRSFSDPAAASNYKTHQAKDTSHNRVYWPDKKDLFKGYNANALGPTDTYRPNYSTSNPRFNFNSPFVDNHTKWTARKLHSRHGSGSTYTGDDMDLGSPKSKAQTQAKTNASRYDRYRPRYPSMPVDANTSFWAGHLNQSQFQSSANNTSQLPPHSPNPTNTHSPYNPANGKAYDGPSGSDMGDISTASGYIGYDSAWKANQGVFGNYADADSHEREKKKVRVNRIGEEEQNHEGEEWRLLQEGIREGINQKAVDGVDVAGDDTEMGGE